MAAAAWRGRDGLAWLTASHTARWMHSVVESWPLVRFGAYATTIPPVREMRRSRMGAVQDGESPFGNLGEGKRTRRRHFLLAPFFPPIWFQRSTPESPADEESTSMRRHLQRPRKFPHHDDGNDRLQRKAAKARVTLMPLSTAITFRAGANNTHAAVWARHTAMGCHTSSSSSPP